jgi:transketolase
MINVQKKLRLKLLKLYFDAKCGHIGCSLSCLDIIYTIFNIKLEEEKMILSKGHAAGALYIILNHFNEISDKELTTYYQNGTKLSAHPSANHFNNIPFALGSLGHGLPIATGMAFSNKFSKQDRLTYVLMSDGETNEGSTWEAAHFAVKNELSNLLVFIDKNNLQGFGETKDVLGDTSNINTWKNIGFDCIEIDGHDINLIEETISMIKSSNNRFPKLIICKTIKGKGVDFMENKLEWHYLPMDELLYQNAVEYILKN